MGLVADGRAGASPPRAPEVGGDLRAAEGQGGTVPPPGILAQLARGRRDVDDQPVPPARPTRRRVRIVNEEREALRIRWRARPAQGRGDVLAGAAEAVEYLLHGDLTVRLEVPARELERRARDALLAGFSWHDFSPRGNVAIVARIIRGSFVATHADRRAHRLGHRAG